jgi:hypothetical protein
MRPAHVPLRNAAREFDRVTSGRGGSKDVRNSHDLSVGLQTTRQYWLLGATTWLDSVGQSFYGWLGDVRIVNRPLSVSEFMISRQETR